MSTYGSALTALADPTRRAIFELVAEKPSAVGELASRVPVSRPAVSQHLRVLKDAGLVVDRPVGTRRVYALDPHGISALRTYFEQFWDQALGAFARAAEQTRGEQTQVEQTHKEHE